MRDDQLQFQSDIKSTLTSFQTNKFNQQDLHNTTNDSGFVIDEGSISGVRKGGGMGFEMGGYKGVGSDSGAGPRYGGVGSEKGPGVGIGLVVI